MGVIEHKTVAVPEGWRERIAEQIQKGRSRSQPLDGILHSMLPSLFAVAHTDASWRQKFNFRFITIEEAEKHIYECEQCGRVIKDITFRLNDLSRSA